MFRQVAFLAILAMVGGCYVDENKGAKTKFQAGGGDKSPPETETFYLASVAAGYDFQDTKGKVDGSQTIFLTRLDYNYATGEARVMLKTVDKHGAVSSACDELTGALISINEDGSYLDADVEFRIDHNKGSQIRFKLRGWADFRGTRVQYDITDSTIRVSEGMARHAPGERFTDLQGELKEVSHVTGGSKAHQNYMEAIKGIPGHQAEGYHASTGLLTESFLNDNNRMRSLNDIGVPQLDSMHFWQDAFSNCSSSSPSSEPTPNNAN